MSGDPHVIARNVRATRSTVEAIAAKLGIELDEHGEPVEPRPAALTKDELDALPLYAAVLCVDEYRHVYLALKVGVPQGSGGHTWRTTDYATIPGSGRLAGDNAVLLDRGLTALVLMGFAPGAARAAAPVQADALTGADQVPDVVHARHEPVVGHSRHDAPRDIPSSVGGPATTPALDRADATYRAHRLVVDGEGAAPSCAACEFVTPRAADGEWDHPAFHRHRIAATVSAVLHDPGDPDWLARALADERGADFESRRWEFTSMAYAAQDAILGARGEEVDRG